MLRSWRKNWHYILGILLVMIMAWRSEGFYHPDEHFQLLEFANYKSGLTAKEGLAWEYHAQIRPGLQPFIAYSVFSICRAIQLDNPFFLAFILRFISGVLNLILIFQIGKYLFKDESKSLQQVFWGLCFFLWFGAFLTVRFSSENWSSMAFFTGLLILFKMMDRGIQKNAILLLSGLLIGLSFQFRYQMSFAILGLAIWLLYYKKLSFKEWQLLISGGLLSLAMGLVFDYWLYGQWQLTPLKYFQSNIMEGKAATFGVEPWWFYFTEGFGILGPGLNMVLISLLLYGLWISRKHPLSWIFIVFLIGHIPVSHKEFRFLFPVLIPFLFAITQGWGALSKNIRSHPLTKFGLGALLMINLLLLTYRVKEAANIHMPYYRFLFNHGNTGNEILLFFYEEEKSHYTNNIYGPPRLRFTFYRPPQLKEVPIIRPTDMDNYRLIHGRSFVLNIYKTLPVSFTKDQFLAFHHKAWMTQDLKNFQFFQNSSLNWKIFRVNNK